MAKPQARTSRWATPASLPEPSQASAPGAPAPQAPPQAVYPPATRVVRTSRWDSKQSEPVLSGAQREAVSALFSGSAVGAGGGWPKGGADAMDATTLRHTLNLL
jgi:hypothetical protein